MEYQTKLPELNFEASTGHTVPSNELPELNFEASTGHTVPSTMNTNLDGVTNVDIHTNALPRKNALRLESEPNNAIRYICSI